MFRHPFQTLHLASVELTTLSHLPSLSFLQEIHLSHNHLSSLDKCPTLFPTLEVLDVRWNKLQAVETLYPLSMARRLTELMVQGNEFAVQKEVVHSCIRDVLPNVEVLDSVSPLWAPLLTVYPSCLKKKRKKEH